MGDSEILLRNAMEQHGAAVYRLALCRMQSVQDAEDVYQEVFLRLLGQEASSWDAEHLRAWLLRCTVNRCCDLHRFRLRRPVLALADLPEMEVSGQRRRRAVGRGGPAAGEAARHHPPVLCRGVFHGGDRRAAGHPGGHGPHPAPPGPEQTARPAGRRRP